MIDLTNLEVGVPPALSHLSFSFPRFQKTEIGENKMKSLVSLIRPENFEQEVIADQKMLADLISNIQQVFERLGSSVNLSTS